MSGDYVEYLDWVIWKAVALCALAFVYGFWKRIIETRPPVKPDAAKYRAARLED